MPAAPASRVAGPRLQVRCAMQSDTGCVRQHNEDAVGCTIPRDDDPYARAGTLVVVADGLGGHAAGEVASGIALRTVLHAYYRSPGPPAAALSHAFVLADQAIHERAAADPACAGMGTTCSAVAIVDGLAHIVHVGDSRIYLQRDGTLTQLTEDDSLVAEMVRAGTLTREAARSHPQRHVLLRVLGTAGFRPAAASDALALRHGDALVLCTDGITEQIDESTLAAVVAGHDPVDACRRLVEIARQAGGADNATVAICTLHGQDNAATGVRTTRDPRASP